MPTNPNGHTNLVPHTVPLPINLATCMYEAMYAADILKCILRSLGMKYREEVVHRRHGLRVGCRRGIHIRAACRFGVPVPHESRMPLRKKYLSGNQRMSKNESINGSLRAIAI